MFWEIYLEDESVAKKVLAKAKAGQNFEKLAEKYSKDKFYNQQYRDLIKQDLCRKNNVLLITVPYNIPPDKIKGFLMKELKKSI